MSSLQHTLTLLSLHSSESRTGELHSSISLACVSITGSLCEVAAAVQLVPYDIFCVV
jgi:hypothetical protein